MASRLSRVWPVSNIAMRAGVRLRLLAGILGVSLLTYLVWRAGPARLFASISALGWGLSLVIALGGVSHLVKTWAWRLTLLDEKHHASFARMLALRLGSEAVGQLGILGQAFGETLRVSLLGSTMPLASGITSVTLDRVFFILSGAVVSTLGLIAVLAILPLPHALSLYAGLFAFILLGVILVAAQAVRKRWTVFSGSARVLSRVRYFSGWLERKRSLIHLVENKLLDFYHHTPGVFWGSFALNLACHGAAVLEVYLILWLMGVKVSFIAALAVEALTKLVNVVGVFNPGNIGTYEGGNMLILRIFGLSASAGLTLAFTRRLRAIFWAAVGSLCLVVLSKSRKAAIPIAEQPTQTKQRGGRSNIAIILADSLNGGSFQSRLSEVGALPVLLRAILGAQKAGAARIILVVDETTRSVLVRDLQRTGRLPGSLEWFQAGAGQTSLPCLLGKLVGQGDERLILIAGDTTYHPSLHRRAAEWSEEADALALTTVNRLVGIYALSQDAAKDLAQRAPSGIDGIQELDAWLTVKHSVDREEVQADQWQRVLTPEDRLAAERKLDRWLVKPTDGVFARMNRRVSIPISRLLIRFPISPNMVTLFTLGVSLLAGMFFAFGGYLNMLFGALLSLFASILDGSDGEVARLKLQESDFGCWLETICDYLYYLFIFAGMTIGLVRSSGTRSYLVWGALLLFGAVASFFVTGLQRRRLTAGRPEQLLAIWQARAASRRSNPFLYFGRHTEFVVRRCFMPYALLFFALFNITQVVFILAALGANVVWMIALYSHLTFSATPPSTLASPRASA
jgi:phosphatidylglycerophosphate synthase